MIKFLDKNGLKHLWNLLKKFFLIIPEIPGAPGKALTYSSYNKNGELVNEWRNALVELDLGNRNYATGEGNEVGYSGLSVGDYNYANGGSIGVGEGRCLENGDKCIRAEGSGCLAGGYVTSVSQEEQDEKIPLKTICAGSDGTIAWGSIYGDGCRIETDYEGSFAIGYIDDNGKNAQIKTNGCGTMALGYINRESGTILADNPGSFAGGYIDENGGQIIASGQGSFAFGKIKNPNGKIEASGDASHAEGGDTTASGDCSHAEGYYTRATGHAAHAEGMGLDSDETAEFICTVLTDAQKTAVENDYGINFTYCDTEDNIDDDWGSQGWIYSDENCTNLVGEILISKCISAPDTGEYPSGDYFNLISGTLTNGTTYYWKRVCGALGECSHAEGGNTKASNYSSHAEGYSTTASGYASHAEGDYTTASNYYSHAEGDSTIASGYASHAEGEDTIASGDYSHAEGYGSTASGYASHAEGVDTKTSGYYSHAEGQNTTASGWAAHAEGSYTTASGEYSHAEGENTTASGKASHAEGYNTTASGDYSHAEGKDTITSGHYSHIEGRIESKTIPGTMIYKPSGITHCGAMWDWPDETLIFIDSNLSRFLVEGAVVKYIDQEYIVDPWGTKDETKSYSHTWTSDYSKEVIFCDLTHKNLATGETDLDLTGLKENQILDITIEVPAGGITGNYSHAEGLDCYVGGDYSHAEGVKNQISGNGSHVEGSGNMCAGDYSSVAGIDNASYGLGSVIIGAHNTSRGAGSVTAGALLTNNIDYGTVIGRYNDEYSLSEETAIPILLVGNGNDEANDPHNALEIYADKNRYARAQVLITCDTISLNTEYAAVEVKPGLININIGNTSLALDETKLRKLSNLLV